MKTTTKDNSPDERLSHAPFVIDNHTLSTWQTQGIRIIGSAAIIPAVTLAQNYTPIPLSELLENGIEGHLNKIEDRVWLRRGTLKSKKRDRRYVRWRRIVAFIYSELGMSLSAIGRGMDRHHATVINYINNFDRSFR